MPRTIDEKQMQGKPGEQLLSLDPANPPTRDIPIYTFPRTVYMHPNEPFKTIEHRNARQELVHEEIQQAEHLTQIVACKEHIESAGVEKCKDCETELERVLKQGWTTKPYIPKPLPDPNAGLYGRRGKGQDSAAQTA